MPKYETEAAGDGGVKGDMAPMSLIKEFGESGEEKS